MRLPITATILSAAGEPVYPAGATSPPLRVQFTDVEGTPVDLSNTARAVVKRRRQGADVADERRIDIPGEGAAEGIVEYRLGESDTETPGLLNLRFVIESTTGTTWVLPTDDPVVVSVRPQI